MKKKVSSVEELWDKVQETHEVYWKFSKWLNKTFVSDVPDNCFQREKMLRKRLIGYEAMEKVRKYVSRYCKEIKIVRVEDEVYASSMLVLIPHKKFGITVLFIPQLEDSRKFFLYKKQCGNLISSLKQLKYVYNE